MEIQVPFSTRSTQFTQSTLPYSPSFPTPGAYEHSSLTKYFPPPPSSQTSRIWVETTTGPVQLCEPT